MTIEAKIAELAERVEKAAGPDETLDADIAESQGICVRHEMVMTGEPGRQSFGCQHCGSARATRVPAYTAYLDAAITLVPEGWRAGFEENSRFDEPGKSYAWVWPFESDYDPDWQNGQEGQQSNPDAQKGYAATPALALCAAALKARATLEGTPHGS